MPSLEGNSNALKFGTPELRQQLCRDYIAHIEAAYSDKCFPECDPQPLRKYIRDFPVDFDIDAIEVARRQRHPPARGRGEPREVQHLVEKRDVPQL